MLETYVEQVNDAYQDGNFLRKSYDEFEFCPEDLFSGEYADSHITMEDLTTDLAMIGDIVEECTFFKNKDKKKVERVTFILRALTAFAAKNSANVLVYVDFADDSVHIDISAEAFMLSGPLLGVFGYVLIDCTDVLFCDNSIIFSYSFS